MANNILKYSVKTGHPHFLNQLFSRSDQYGLVGQWLTDTLNVSVYTYEVVLVPTLIAGTFSNETAIKVARFLFKPEVKIRGTPDSNLIFFASEEQAFVVSARGMWYS